MPRCSARSYCFFFFAQMETEIAERLCRRGKQKRMSGNNKAVDFINW